MDIDFCRLKSEYLTQEQNEHTDDINLIGVDQSKPETAEVKLVVTYKDRLHDQDFACNICDQKYVYKKHLDRHISLHGKLQ